MGMPASQWQLPPKGSITVLAVGHPSVGAVQLYRVGLCWL